MKKFPPLNTSLMTLLVVGLMLFASCAKEPLVAPVSLDGSAKNANLAGSVVDPGTSAESGDGKRDSDPGDGISDDGDDLSDKERSHKKKVN